MLYILFSQAILVIFVSCSIVILSWLFPVERKVQKKQK